MEEVHSPLGPDPEILKSLIVQRMPFGKYKDWVIADLPVSYLEWFEREGFPKGKLGMQLRTMYEIQINGLMFIIHDIRRLARK